MSAGTTISPGSNRAAGRTETTPAPAFAPGPDAASRPTSAPAAASIRSVWSRLGTGSRTRVSPAASSPASSTQDFTWALATGSS